MNKVILKGRLARDPELRYTTSGKAVCSFTLAVDRKHQKDTPGPTADFIPCIAWEGIGKTIADHVPKGRELLVEGRLQIRSYNAQDGSKRYVTEVVLIDMDFCGSKPSSGGGGVSEGDNNPGGFGGTTVPDDDIPF